MSIDIKMKPEKEKGLFHVTIFSHKNGAQQHQQKNLSADLTLQLSSL
jgi:hypothetical protein